MIGPKRRLTAATAPLFALALDALTGARPASAVVVNHEEQYRVSVGAHPDLGFDRFTLATLNRAADGSESVVVRAIERSGGSQAGNALVLDPTDLGTRAPLVDVLLSSITDGTSNTFVAGSLLVLDAEGIVIFLSIEYAGDGTPLVGGPPAFLGPVVPRGRRATVLGEAPNPDDAGQPFLAVGTSSGDVILLKLADGVNRVVTGIVTIPTGNPVQDLGAIPGSPDEYMFGVSVAGSPDLFVVDPDADSTTEALEPRTAFTLRDPRRTPLVDFAPTLLAPDSRPIADPDSEALVTANGTTEITTFRLPAGHAGGTLEVLRVEGAATPVKQVVLGSLTLLPFDGTGILYNKAFTPTGGFAGRLWTIAGASMVVAPRTLNLGSQGRFVTVWIEVENGGAAEIDPGAVELSVDGLAGVLEPAQPPRLLDRDGDGNADLEVRFNRGELIGILDHNPTHTAILRAHWLYQDGPEGEASVELRVRHDE